MTYNRSMKYAAPALLGILFLSGLLSAQNRAVSYMTGISYTDTILYGDRAWDHLDQFNMLTGMVYTSPLEGTDRYSSRIRVAFNQPLWARIRQLDGETPIIQVPDRSVRYGANFFAGLEIPRAFGGNLFPAALSLGPTVDFQAFPESMLLTLGFEGSLEGRLPLGGGWSFLLGTSLAYNYWGLHTVGETSRYEIYIKRGWGIMVYPGFKYRY